MTADQLETVRDNALVVASNTQACMETQRIEHTMRQRFVKRLALCALAATLAGCATAAQRFEQGTALESSGQRTEAVRRYSQALRKDPGHLESRQRLIVLAPEVLDGYLVQSANDTQREAFTHAADAVLTADDLLANMRALAITVAVPIGYAAMRRDLLERAIGQSMREAQRATIDGHWAQAMGIYQQIARFEPSAQQAQRVQEARIDNLIQAGQAGYDSGHFREALGHVEQALDIPLATRHNELHQLHDQIVHAGTRRVLFLPVSPPPPGTPAPPRFTRSVDNALQRDHWRNLPALVDAIDATFSSPRLRRKIRWLHDAHARPSRAQIVRAGRMLDADWVVLISLEDFSQAEKITSRKQRAAKLRNGAKTNYEVRSARLTSTATARYELVSVTGTQPDRHARVRVRESGRFNDAFYNGDVRQLSLSKKERALFRSKSSTPTRQAFERELAHALAARIARPVLRHLDSN
jgi:hypothetical protein